ncbi:MAG: hypothetical protein A2725_04620 [Candidatus Magasanikbacteria bacterium RIFCSPHIGHO2_01_FULL_33_34]|uniref:DUF5658 domain-containing protein n=1 Tax=Candidatus Magasanikbacteria bacterium RIFCSPHIGHO2_01_FULL_33_34 TaxID=1798671 RepID=A0A1F6LLA7_9BACT|nr:MAG: hypothetical protein A2725_04620 [Candidatus Magasanikbacteria bacterium RIFCSPHIGHO2_01_FULL_33_34]OGH65962.1 MAG: hypothetical protein A3B83_02440 [Candidatus Magasanikbacteria bacterium RIFCSPHIGHO2_02_FULL_33_17]OGH76357.1 MAG: hypothetical protein A3A89_00980 [Candidatus Magasanikbacteria bacterium RIFCSPLOWO2_01_FULL_33_34]OGH82276.1 MAG: hypothetical protein A3F93_03235 [Candidatus Magasanikbacteria bacterium RIFCSPLOWO2_12_FULL_34_7]
MRTKFIIISLFLLAIAIIFDTVSTFVFSFKPNFSEKNPNMSWWLEQGSYYFIAIKLLQQFVSLLLLWLARKHKYIPIVTFFLLLIHAYIVFLHIQLWQKF